MRRDDSNTTIPEKIRNVSDMIRDNNLAVWVLFVVESLRKCEKQFLDGTANEVGLKRVSLTGLAIRVGDCN